ncbi:MAG: hypothetical protein KGH86_08555, partial [Thaumarchaeota archaeon]|nr:hypothetical protein [Nitrososphaerota archaeon]
DSQKGPAKWDGEIMRTSIAGTLILLYIIVIAANVFPTSYIYTCESEPDNNGSNSTSIASKNSNTNATANVVKESTTCKSLLDNFGNVIIVVIGFYFGSKTAIQIYQNYKGSQTNNANSDKTANQNQK